MALSGIQGYIPPKSVTPPQTTHGSPVLPRQTWSAATFEPPPVNGATIIPENPVQQVNKAPAQTVFQMDDKGTTGFNGSNGTQHD